MLYEGVITGAKETTKPNAPSTLVIYGVFEGKRFKIEIPPKALVSIAATLSTIDDGDEESA